MMMVVVTDMIDQCVCMISTTEACVREFQIPVSWLMDEHISPSSSNDCQQSIKRK